MKRKRKIKAPSYAFGINGAQIKNFLSGAGEQVTKYEPYFSGGSALTGTLISALSNEDSTGAVAGSTISGLGTGAAAGSVLGPIGTGVGAAIGGIGGLFTARSRRRQLQEQRRKQATARQTRAGLNAAAQAEEDYWDDNSLAYTYENGGILPNLAYVDNNEVLRDYVGNITQVPNTMPGTDNHLIDSTNLESVLSDKLKVPGTKRTFAEEGKKLAKMTKPSKGKDIFAENTNKLNKRNANKQYEQLLASQAEVQTKRGVKPKTKGVDVPAYEDGDDSLLSSIRKSLWPTQKELEEWATANPSRVRGPRRLHRSVRPSLDYVNTPDTRSNVLNRPASRNSETPAASTPEVYTVNEIPKPTVNQPEYPTKFPRIHDGRPFRGEFYDWNDPEYANNFINWVKTNDSQITPALGEIDPTLSLRRTFPTYMKSRLGPTRKEQTTALKDLQTQSQSDNDTQIPDLGNTQNTVTPTVQATTSNTPTIDTPLLPEPEIPKLIVNQPEYPTTAPRVYIPRGKRPRNSNSNGASGYTSEWLSLAPTLYNFVQGVRGPENEELITNPYAGTINHTMARRKMNIEPIKQANRRSRAISNYNLARLNANTGANLAARNQAAVSEYDANANMWATKQNADNQYLGEYANMLNNLGQQYVQSANLYNDNNARNRATARNFTSNALSQLGEWSQVRNQEYNQYKRDAALWPYMEDYLRRYYPEELVNNTAKYFSNGK